MSIPVATALSYLGAAKEATKGTGVPPTVFWPVKTINPHDRYKKEPVKVYKGAMAETYGYVPTLKWTEWEVGGPFFPDTSPWPIAGIFGDMVETGTTSGGSTTLAAGASAGATTISSTANEPVSTIIQLDTGSVAEVRTVTATSGSGPFTLTLSSPLYYAHSNGATVQPVIAPITHTMSLLNGVSVSGQPTAHTLTDFYGLSTGSPARQYAGVQWHELTIKWTADGLIEWTAKGSGLVPSAPAAKPAQSFSTVLPLAVWTGVVTIGGTQILTAMEGEITFTRKMILVPGVNNTQQYQSVFLGPLGIKGKYAAWISDDTELTRYLNDTNPAMNFNFSATGIQLMVNCNQTDVIDAKPNRGKEMVVYDVEWEAIANSTDTGNSGGFSPGKVTVQNAVTGGTYV